MTTHLDTPVGTTEVAALLGVDVRTVHQWKRRKTWGANDPVRAAKGRGGHAVQLPDYDWESVNGIGAWKWRSILRWAGLTGRLAAPELVEQYRKAFGEDPRAERRAGMMTPDERQAVEAKVNGRRPKKRALTSRQAMGDPNA